MCVRAHAHVHAHVHSEDITVPSRLRLTLTAQLCLSFSCQAAPCSAVMTASIFPSPVQFNIACSKLREVFHPV